MHKDNRVELRCSTHNGDCLFAQPVDDGTLTIGLCNVEWSDHHAVNLKPHDAITLRDFLNEYIKGFHSPALAAPQTPTSEECERVCGCGAVFTDKVLSELDEIVTYACPNCHAEYMKLEELSKDTRMQDFDDAWTRITRTFVAWDAFTDYQHGALVAAFDALKTIIKPLIEDQ